MKSSFKQRLSAGEFNCPPTTKNVDVQSGQTWVGAAGALKQWKSPSYAVQRFHPLPNIPKLSTLQRFVFQTVYLFVQAL